jgi:hypothetical protein
MDTNATLSLLFASPGKTHSMKHLIICFCAAALLISTNAGAQKKETIYLKNGSIISGKVISRDTGSKVVKIQTEGNTWAFPIAEIDSVQSYKSPSVFNQRGYYAIVSMGLQFGNTNYYYGGPSAGFSLNVVNGYRFDRYKSLGVATGFDFYSENEFIPVNIDFRGTLFDRKITPYYFAQAGYGFLANKESKDSKGGINFGAGLGYLLSINNSTGFFFEAGYRQQEATVVYYSDWGPWKTVVDYSFRRTSFKVGFMF